MAVEENIWIQLRSLAISNSTMRLIGNGVRPKGQRTTHRISKDYFIVFSLEDYAVLALHLHQLGGHVIKLVHENQFWFSGSRVRVEFDSVGVKFGVSGLPSGGERTAKFFDVAVNNAIRF